MRNIEKENAQTKGLGKFYMYSDKSDIQDANRVYHTDL